MLQQSHSLLQAQSRNKLSGQFSGNSRHGIGAASRHAVAASSSQMAVFPAGRKQVKVTLPAFIIIVSATEVLQRRDSIAEGIGAAISDGATGILLGDAQGLGEHKPLLNTLHKSTACQEEASQDFYPACYPV